MVALLFALRCVCCERERRGGGEAIWSLMEGAS